ncbi:MAG: hypothetical protein Q8O61_00975, partial [Nocardioides sp.]|nr:hypothetical protein [Nocardioides sp.]
MVMTVTSTGPDRGRRSAVRRLVVAAVSVATCLGGLSVAGVLSAEGSSFPQAVDKADCGPGARPETDIQGRVPQRDYDTGRVKRGYQCNTRMVSHQGTHGGFKTLRYTDRTGRTCAFYDSTRLFPADVLLQARSGSGVVVLDMTNPAKPRRTANLTTPAMLSPHESLLVEPRRGLLAATM